MTLRPHSLFCLTLTALVGGLLMSGIAQAGIAGINSSGSSIATVNFDDTNSVAPPAGITNSGPSVTPWNGPAVTLPGTTDPNTGDFATGSIVGSFTPSSNNYSLSFNSITLTQAPGNTGYASLDFTFNIEYQLDNFGLPSQATLFPNFIVNGTVQGASSSFASISGVINYNAVNTAGAIGTVETVNYNSLWTTPGPFSGTVAGVPVFGFTPALVPNTTLTLSGVMHFKVDPATINVQTVPEPSTCLLGIFGAAGLFVIGRRRRAAKSA